MSETPQSDPSTESEYVDPADLEIKRDDTGDILPVDEETSFGMVSVKPMPYGTIERYFGDRASVASADLEEIVPVYREHVIEPDLQARAREKRDGELTTYLTEDVAPAVPGQLLQAIMSASDVDASVDVEDGTATVDMREGNAP
jgi:hypothetical protein